MMHPIAFPMATTLPAAPAVSASLQASPQVRWTWTDATPATPANLGDPANEIGFRMESAADGGYMVVGLALANQTAYVDATVSSGHTYTYRVVAYDASGDSAPAPSAPVVLP